MARKTTSRPSRRQGTALRDDLRFREKIIHFDHERIPERVTHARGSGAHGYFESYRALGELTRAAPFAAVGKHTPVFARFSTLTGERGSKDTARDVRGFAVKFYTEDGNWDLVGHNLPVFFIQDAMRFPDLMHALKPEPHHGMPQATSAHDTFWDFVSLMPETAHMLLWLMSDRALPCSYRMMPGFGVHTYQWLTADGDASFVKFHWTPLAGVHSLVWEEAVKIAGVDPDYHRRDLWDAIEAGHFPEWELGVQIFSREEADKFSFDVLDATKLIPEELVPVVPVGRLVLNRNPDNFFAETEQVAFSPAHLIPGIDVTRDPLLIGRLQAYADSQISRLGGPNYGELPINVPRVSGADPLRDGYRRDGSQRRSRDYGRVAYQPSSLVGECGQPPAGEHRAVFSEPAGQPELRGRPARFAEHYNQARLFYQSQEAVDREHIVEAFRFELSCVTVPAIRERTLAMLHNVSRTLAQDVAGGLGMDLPPAQPAQPVHPKPPGRAEVTCSRRLCARAYPGDGGIRSRRVAVLVAGGIKEKSLRPLLDELAREGAQVKLVGTRLGPLATAEGAVIEADASLDNQAAVLFDGLLVPDGDDAVETLLMDVRALEFIRDSVRHFKSILAVGAGARLVRALGVEQADSDPGLLWVSRGSRKAARAFIDALAKHRHPRRKWNPPHLYR